MQLVAEQHQQQSASYFAESAVAKKRWTRLFGVFQKARQDPSCLQFRLTITLDAHCRLLCFTALRERKYIKKLSILSKDKLVTVSFTTGHCCLRKGPREISGKQKINTQKDRKEMSSLTDIRVIKKYFIKMWKSWNKETTLKSCVLKETFLALLGP